MNDSIDRVVDRLNDGSARSARRPKGHVAQERRVGEHCRLPDCGRPTMDKKPFCTRHVEHAPYAKHLVGELALRKEEAREITDSESRRAGRVSLFGVLARETLRALYLYERLTSSQLARQITCTKAVAKAIGTRFVAAGWAAFHPRHGYSLLPDVIKELDHYKKIEEESRGLQQRKDDPHGDSGG